MVTLPDVWSPYRQHTHGISRKSLGRNFDKSDSTIARYYDHMYDLENRKLMTLQVPRVLGIDEHFFFSADAVRDDVLRPQETPCV